MYQLTDLKHVQWYGMKDPVQRLNDREFPGIRMPWSRTSDEIYADFSTRASGLTADEVTERTKKYGSNTFKKKKKLSYARLIWRQFSSPLIFVLVGAAVVTTILKEPIDTTVILLAILVNAALGFYQEHKAENAIDKLSAYIKERTRVVRDGQEQEIDSADVVPGDVVRLAFGGRVPADMRLVSVQSLSVDEAILTGESLPVGKQAEPVAPDAAIADRLSMAFAGSLVVEGHGTGIVVGTAEHTEIGRIAALVSGTTAEKTPLQKSLESLAWIIFVGVTVIVVGIFFLGLSRGEPFLDMLLLSAAVAVGAIPEALPIALTVILAVGVERIAKKKGVMRSLAAAETLGSTTLIMTDKTGTLTQAKMELTSVVTLAELMNGTWAADSASVLNLSSEHERMVRGALIATDVVIENPYEAPESWRYIGRPLESNVARAAHVAGIDVVDLTTTRRASVIPFSSHHKFSAGFDSQEKALFVFGAPDILLARSSLGAEVRARLEAEIHRISDEGKRLLGIGTYTIAAAERHLTHAPDEVQQIDFLGVLVLYDPVRPEAKAALERITSYGVQVVMVTGDLKGTARAIARELGWHVSPERVLTGAEIRDLSDEVLSEAMRHTEIFARMTPEDKLRVGRLYQARGEIVAMTGDGVNDAPSLKAVDIGIALGSGSDVAKGVADLVLLNDDFTTIVRAIEEGRRIISNIRKTFVYLMANCLDEVILVGGGLLMGLPLPLNALQIIWVNFFTGSFPSLSFAFEEANDVHHGNASKNQSIFNRDVQILTVAVGVVTSIALFIFYRLLIVSGFEVPIARSLLFACFASYILIIAFSFKNLRAPIYSYSLTSNVPLVLSTVGALILLVLSFIVPFLRNILDIVPIPVSLWWIIGVWLVGNVALVEAVKYVLARMGR